MCSKALDIGSPNSCVYTFLPEDIQEAGKCIYSSSRACMAIVTLQLKINALCTHVASVHIYLKPV